MLEQPGLHDVPGDMGAYPLTDTDTPALCNEATGPRVAGIPLSIQAAPICQNAASLWRLVNQQKGRRDLGPSLSDLFL